MTYSLEISNLSKHFNDKKVLNNINLTLNTKEIFGLIGLNGAGKTTLIKTILNLLSLEVGSIKVFNESVTNPKSRQNIKYLPEKFQANSMLKGIEFLKIFSQTTDENKIYELANILNFDKDNLQKKVSKYSKGMMQKLGLISTFLDDSKLVILDEPMSGLDPKARIFLKNLLLKSRDNGKTIFFSSHILSDIDEICDRIAILNNSQLVFIGTPKELKEKYSQDSLEKAFLKQIS